MFKAALYVAGRIVVADSHLQAWQQLSTQEQDAKLVSGFFDSETDEFVADCPQDNFYDKEMYLIRHGESVDPTEPDPDISQAGIRQVVSILPHLASLNLGQFTCFTSPLLRCLRTAEILSQSLNIHFSIMPEMMETPAFLKEEQAFKVRNRSQMFPCFDWPTSKEWHVCYETPEDFMSRVKDTLQRLPAKSILVTHYGFICNIARLTLINAKASIMIRDGLPPASVTHIQRQDVRSLGT